MFINFWYPVILARDLGDKPQKVQMLGCDFVVYRAASGQVVCLSNTCAHRGGSLGHGRVRGERVECPYHGWQYDATGACRKIPALGPEGRIPARAAVDSYPVEERYGMVFAFLGDLPEVERPPIQTVSEWDDPAWRGTWVAFTYDANIQRCIENSLDPAHNEFVHFNHGHQGDRDEYRLPAMDIREEEWGAAAHMVMPAPRIKKGALKELRTEEGKMDAATGYRGPHQHWNQLHISPTMWLHQYQFAVPIDARRSRFFLLNMRNSWLQPENDQRFDGRNVATTEEDHIVLREMRPVVPADSAPRELLVSGAGDDLVGHYRQALERWAARGWRIDADRLAERQQHAALTIPSPARRERQGWVLEAVPLVAAVGGASAPTVGIAAEAAPTSRRSGASRDNRG
jgi:phenylpropionate dioxygenase-like ring-hydroxylating dioxygenase large terminal subunit